MLNVLNYIKKNNYWIKKYNKKIKLLVFDKNLKVISNAILLIYKNYIKINYVNNIITINIK